MNYNVDGKIKNVSMHVLQEHQLLIVVLIQLAFGILIKRNVMLIFVKTLQQTLNVLQIQNVYGVKQMTLSV